ncbi:hypothetical protein BDW66DRAFT_131139 [Aspergillus desertorum]
MLVLSRKRLVSTLHPLTRPIGDGGLRSQHLLVRAFSTRRNSAALLCPCPSSANQVDGQYEAVCLDETFLRRAISHDLAMTQELVRKIIPWKWTEVQSALYSVIFRMVDGMLAKRLFPVRTIGLLGLYEPASHKPPGFAGLGTSVPCPGLFNRGLPGLAIK